MGHSRPQKESRRATIGLVGLRGVNAQCTINLYDCFIFSRVTLVGKELEISLKESGKLKHFEKHTNTGS